MRWLLLVAVAGLVGCGQSKPDVWSEYADATQIVTYEEHHLDQVQKALLDDPTPENKALEAKVKARWERAVKRLGEVRDRLP